MDEDFNKQTFNAELKHLDHTIKGKIKAISKQS